MKINKGIQIKKEQEKITNVAELIEYGNHTVAVMVMQIDGSRRSMAEHGFLNIWVL